MADPVWGQLVKAQDNDQTIDQAIAAAIAAHETDPDAHTGAGESLETHKSQEVVDHPQGSILADKFSFTELIAEAGFETLDNWNTKVNATLENWPGVRINYNWAGPTAGTLASEPTAPADFFDDTKDTLFQVTMFLYEDTDVSAYAGIMDYINANNLIGFGFAIVNGIVKGFCGTGAGPTFTADLSINAEEIHIYRAIYSYANNTVKFYIDGVLKATITDARTYFDMSTKITFKYIETAEVDGFMQMYDVTVAREI